MRSETAPGGGCIAGVVTLVFLAGLLAVFFVLAMGNLADARAGETRAQADLEYERGRSTALIIQAAGQARLDSALATAIISSSALPWGVLGILGLLGLAVCGLVALAILRRPQAGPPPTRIIERQIIMLPPPGQTRRELWQALAAGKITIEGG